MQLRDHPIFKITADVNWWPPTWVSERDPEKKLRGEVGFLINTELRSHLPTFIFLRIRRDGELFLGAMHVSDLALCRQLHALIQQHKGKTIRQIGDLEVDFLF